MALRVWHRCRASSPWSSWLTLAISRVGRHLSVQQLRELIVPADTVNLESSAAVQLE